jgi:hypothetical protein
MAEVARQLACSASTVRRRLRQWTIPARGRGLNTAHRRAHGAHGASAWSAEAAWIVGLMASDGNLARTGHALTLTSNDVELLEPCAPFLASATGSGGCAEGGAMAATGSSGVTGGSMPGSPTSDSRHERASRSARWWCPTNTSPISSVGASMVTGRFSCTRTAIRRRGRRRTSMRVSMSRSYRPAALPQLGRDGRQAPRPRRDLQQVGRTRADMALRYAKRESLRLLPWMYPARLAVSGASGPRPTSSCRDPNEGMLWGACR